MRHRKLAVRAPFLAVALALAFAAASIPAGATAAEGDAPSGDAARLQGRWTAHVEPRPGIRLDLTYIFDGTHVTVRVGLPDAKQIDIAGEYRIDEAARPHKTIDWVRFADDKGNPRPDKPAIYTFEGDDTLKVCLAGGDGIRPSEFGPAVPENGRGPSTLTFTRQTSAARADAR
jgi:uncharacterized protein (TIGR03067 family)